MHSNEVYLYHFVIDHQHQLDDSALSAEEKKRAERFIKTEDQQRFRFCYIHLRNILAKHLHIFAHEITFVRNQCGKPYIDKKQNSKSIYFNLSHSKHHFLLGIALHEIGVDIEETNRTNDIDSLAKYSFSNEEYQTLCRLNDKQKLIAFYKAWTCKEAFVKALGMGMHFSFKDFSVETNPNKPAKLLQINSKIHTQDAWSITHKQLEQQAQLAIAEKRSSPSTLIWC